MVALAVSLSPTSTPDHVAATGDRLAAYTPLSELSLRSVEDADTGVDAGARRPRGQRVQRALSPTEAAARDEMIVKHMPLVRFVANRMSRHAGQSVLLDFDDLHSYGVEGLIEAVDTFDPERGLKFSTWAVMHIRTTIQDALRTVDPLPRSLRAKGKEIDRVSAALAHERGSWPEMAEVADVLGQPLQSVRRTVQDLGQSVLSLEQVDDGRNGASTSGDDTGFSLLNLLSDDDPEVNPEARLDTRELRRMLVEAIAALPSREEVLIEAHYCHGQSMRTISHLLGVSESRVSQLHARAVRLLREHMNWALSNDAPSYPQTRKLRLPVPISQPAVSTTRTAPTATAFAA